MGAGYLAGSFDLLNVKDVDLIEQAVRSCDRLVVGVFTDAHAEAVHGRVPVVPLTERLALVGHVRGVAEAVVHDEESTGPGANGVLFAVAGEPAPVGSVVLSPNRDTASVALRDALRPVRDEDVA